MEFKGTLKECLPIKEGKNEKGEWISMQFLLSTEGDYANDLIFTAFTIDRIHLIKTLKIGDRLNVYAKVYSKKTKNSPQKYYTFLIAHQIETLTD
jgi:hypothetical protein